MPVDLISHVLVSGTWLRPRWDAVSEQVWYAALLSVVIWTLHTGRCVARQNTIEGNYLDGVSVTHGASGSRMHIWTFGAGHPASGGLVARCPCDNSNRGEAPLPPPEVGQNYFCDRADQLDRVWTGENCTDNNPCCSFHNPPYFSVQLSEATTDRIELWICSDQHQTDETILITFAEIYVQ